MGDQDRLRQLAQEATPGPWTHAWDHDWPESEMGEEDLIRAADGSSVAGTAYHDGLHVACTRENAAYIAAANPARILLMLDAIDKAREQLKLRDERVHIATSNGSTATRTEELMSNGQHAEEGWAALRASLAALEGMTP